MAQIRTRNPRALPPDAGVLPCSTSGRKDPPIASTTSRSDGSTSAITGPVPSAAPRWDGLIEIGGLSASAGMVLLLPAWLWAGGPGYPPETAGPRDVRTELIGRN